MKELWSNYCLILWIFMNVNLRITEKLHGLNKRFFTVFKFQSLWISIYSASNIKFKLFWNYFPIPPKVTVIPVSEDGTPLEADAFVEGPEELVIYLIKLYFQIIWYCWFFFSILSLKHLFLSICISKVKCHVGMDEVCMTFNITWHDMTWFNLCMLLIIYVNG